MLEFQQKAKLKRFIYSKFTLVIFLVLILLLSNAVWKVYQKQAWAKDNLRKTAASLEALRAREKMLSSKIERLETADGVEEEIREKYGLVKPDEEVITIVDEAATDSAPVSPSVSFWSRIAKWFK